MDQVQPKLVLAFDAKRLFNNFTGLGNYSRTLVKNLQHYFPQHEYHLFTPKITIHAETKYFLDESRFILHTSSFPLWRTLGISFALKKINADIFHGLSHEIPLFLPKRIQSVVTFHDLIYELYPKLFGLWDRSLYKLKYRNSAKRANLILSISESTKKDLMEIYGLPSDKIKVLYQSCQEGFQCEPVSTTSDKENEKKYFLYVGSIIPRKNLLSIIKAFAVLEERYRKPFVVIGSGPPEYLRLVKDEINKNHLEAWFTFIARVDNTELVSIYDGAFALVYPSVYEGFGIPIIESLFRKVPVITSKVSSLPEAAGPGGLCVDPNSIPQLVKSFQEIQNPDVYTSLSTKGHKYVLDHFASENTAKELMSLYLSVRKKGAENQITTNQEL